MRKIAFILTCAVLVAGIGTALATVGVPRTGSQYSGARNPGGCEIFPDNGTELHVKCTEGVGATGGAFIRFRFLKDAGFHRGPAHTTANVKTFVGDESRCVVERWMGPVRTFRLHVLHGCYVHIVGVTAWQDPADA